MGFNNGSNKNKKKKQQEKNIKNSGLPKFAPLAHALRSDQYEYLHCSCSNLLSINAQVVTFLMGFMCPLIKRLEEKVIPENAYKY